MKKACKVASLIVLAILVTVASVYWTPNMVLCVPALAFFSFSLFKNKEKPKSTSADLQLISLSISAVIVVLQVLVILDQNVFICNLTALFMSVLNTILLLWLWTRNRSQNSQE